MKKLFCKLFGHTMIESTMAEIVKEALNKPTFSIICKRCGKELNKNLARKK